MKTSILNYLILIILSSLISCESSDKEESTSPIESDEYEELYGYWRFVYGYHGSDNDSIISSPLPGGMADTVVQYFSKDTVSLLYFPYNLVNSIAYSRKNDSIYYEDELNRELSVKATVRNDTLTLVSRISPTLTFKKLYVRYVDDYERLENLRIARTDWSYVRSLWKINMRGEVPDRIKFEESEWSLPSFIDLRKENEANFQFNMDTLYYTGFDTTWQFRMRALWLPGGMWSDSCMSIFYNTPEGEERMTFYRGLTYE
ncbi:MAG: hypothetical protein GQ574_12560 [Crocinitomix sp.]|nr:hypothetical protein [Crocinitomix sp.]